MRKYQVRGYYTCQSSSSIIYLISYALCSAVYVGETGCKLRQRMTGHRSASNLNNNTDSTVAEHFKQAGHHMRVSVIQSAPEDIMKRRIIEHIWIKRLRPQTHVPLIEPWRRTWHSFTIASLHTLTSNLTLLLSSILHAPVYSQRQGSPLFTNSI